MGKKNKPNKSLTPEYVAIEAPEKTAPSIKKEPSTPAYQETVFPIHFPAEKLFDNNITLSIKEALTLLQQYMPKISNESFFIRGINFILFLIEQKTPFSNDDISCFYDIIFKMLEEKKITLEHNESIYQKIVTLAEDLTKAPPDIFWKILAFNNSLNKPGKISLDSLSDHIDLLIIPTIIQIPPNTLLTIQNKALYESCRPLLAFNSTYAELYISRIKQHWSSDEGLKNAIKLGYADIAVTLLNNQKTLPLDDAIPIKQYVALLSGYSLDEKKKPRTINYYLNSPDPLLPGITLSYELKQQLIIYLVQRVKKENFTLAELTPLLEYTCFSGSDELIEAICVHSIKSEEIPANFKFRDPLSIACDNIGFSTKSLEQLTPPQNQLNRLSKPIYSERSPIYIFLKKYRSDIDKLIKRVDFLFKIGNNLQEKSEDYYTKRALIEYYTVLVYSKNLLSEYKNSKVIQTISKNMACIEQHLNLSLHKPLILIQEITRLNEPFLLTLALKACVLSQKNADSIFQNDLKELADCIIGIALVDQNPELLTALVSNYPNDFCLLFKSDKSKMSLLQPNQLLTLIELIDSKEHLETLENLLLILIAKNDIAIALAINSLKNKGLSAEKIKAIIDKTDSETSRLAALLTIIECYGDSSKIAFMSDMNDLLKNKQLPKKLILTFISWTDPEGYEKLPWDDLPKTTIDLIKKANTALKELSEDALTAKKTQVPFITYREAKKTIKKETAKVAIEINKKSNSEEVNQLTEAPTFPIQTMEEKTESIATEKYKAMSPNFTVELDEATPVAKETNNHQLTSNPRLFTPAPGSRAIHEAPITLDQKDLIIQQKEAIITQQQCEIAILKQQIAQYQQYRRQQPSYFQAHIPTIPVIRLNVIISAEQGGYKMNALGEGASLYYRSTVGSLQGTFVGLPTNYLSISEGKHLLTIINQQDFYLGTVENYVQIYPLTPKEACEGKIIVGHYQESANGICFAKCTSYSKRLNHLTEVELTSESSTVASP